MNETKPITTYLDVGLDAVLAKHANQINTLVDLRRVSGFRFTFFHFLDLLVEVALIAFGSDQKLIPAEMVCMCFERMEMSKGMRELDRKNSYTHNGQITLLASKQTLLKIKEAKPISQKSVKNPESTTLIDRKMKTVKK